MLTGQVKFTPVIVGVDMTDIEQLKNLKISVKQLTFVSSLKLGLYSAQNPIIVGA